MGEELDGRVAIVTGASRGIGKALAIGLADHGAAVACAARTTVEAPDGLPGTIHATTDAITSTGGRALAVRCDIGVESDLEQLVERTVDDFGRLDVLVNNAMAPTRGSFDHTTTGMWDESMTANVRSLFVLAQLVTPLMAAQGGGSIVNISSGGADHAAAPFMPPGFLTYAVAKAAMERFTSGLGPELADRGITVNALRPGAVKTELAEREMGPDHDWSAWAAPDAVVPAAVFLATQIGTDFNGRIVDATQFGVSWP